MRRSDDQHNKIRHNTGLSLLKYTEILAKNELLGRELTGPIYEVLVLSNVVVDLVKEVFEYALRNEGINARVRVGGYDTIVQDSYEYGNASLVVVFWECGNIADGFHNEVEVYTQERVNEYIEKTYSELELVLSNLSSVPLVLINEFSADIFNYVAIDNSALESIAGRLNETLAGRLDKNIKCVSLTPIFYDLGIEQCVDKRYYYTSKAPYTIAFFKGYVDRIHPILLAANGKAKKALIVDCDNTLWKGVVGEDGIDGIDISPANAEGAIFSTVQLLIKKLSQDGVIICLCSKNNPEDVDDVLENHPDMRLRDEEIAIKRVNWDDKPQNISAIADQLNIGIDSMVFVDDSDFEVSLAEEQLPGLTVLKVPENIYDYPLMMKRMQNLFFNLSRTDEDAEKTAMYKQQFKRDSERASHSSLSAYLASLEQKMTVYNNSVQHITRVAQLCQKTNQFNLTAKRYLESDIREFVEDEDMLVSCFSLRDRFGDNGVTGLAIIELNIASRSANIDSFLMSCRVIGRNAEYSFLRHIVSLLKGRGISKLSADYVPTAKNNLTKNFYVSCGFNQVEGGDSAIKFNMDIELFKARKEDHIEVIDAG